ncbi:MAG: hypothetical protein H6555_10030 [Lewinellaceae bacterium]|nr:hypothetical protein [Lewinellaceae bacterium]
MNRYILLASFHSLAVACQSPAEPTSTIWKRLFPKLKNWLRIIRPGFVFGGGFIGRTWKPLFEKACPAVRNHAQYPANQVYSGSMNSLRMWYWPQLLKKGKLRFDIL